MSETLLLDSNVLIALSFPEHVHHRLATGWFAKLNPRFATCPITQGSFVRFTLRNAPGGTGTAKQLLDSLTSMEDHEFWPDDQPYSCLPWRQVHGYRQVTIAYLVALAKSRAARLATLDAALATVFPETVLITE